MRRVVTKVCLLSECIDFLLNLNSIWYYMLSLFKYLHEKYLKSINLRLRYLSAILSCRILNKQRIKYQTYLKSTKIDTFGQEICFCHNTNRLLQKTGHLHRKGSEAEKIPKSSDLGTAEMIKLDH